MTIRTDVALSHTGDVAATPELGGAPTLAANDALMKLAPYTVTVLPTYAEVGLTLQTVSGVPGAAATLPPFVNVNSTDEAAPRAVPAPMTIRTDVALSHTGDVAATPEQGDKPTLAVNEELMKLAPYTVTVLPTYATEGAMEVAIGLLLMVSGVPGDVATLPPFVNVNSTDEAAPRAVPAPMTIRTDVALSHTGDVATTPELGGAPTLAANDALMKLAPYTVTVLPTYATEGATKVAIGLLLMVSGVPGNVATTPPFVYVNSTEAAPRAVPAPMTIRQDVALCHTLEDT
jgi:hypothetical protein